MYEPRVQAANLCRILLFLFTHFVFSSDFSAARQKARYAEPCIFEEVMAVLNCTHRCVHLGRTLLHNRDRRVLSVRLSSRALTAANIDVIDESSPMALLRVSSPRKKKKKKKTTRLLTSSLVVDIPEELVSSRDQDCNYATCSRKHNYSIHSQRNFHN